nr:prolyl 3-hydroxylase sudestada1 [Leptinotarsa decemlineata]
MNFKGKRAMNKSTNRIPSESEDESDNSGSDSSKEEEISYYEESSASEPEIECCNWDDDCRVVSTHESVTSGYHLMPTCHRDPDGRPVKKQKVTPEITKTLLDELKKCWSCNKNLQNNHFELIVEPFKVCVINNLIENSHLLDDIRNEFYELDWNTRNMDLYEFFQSKDLKYLTSEHIRNMFDFLKGDLMQWVMNITGLNLTHVSATCSLYSNTDYLLVHDDQREDRMVAFILYLTGKEGWNESKGGSLQLLNKDDKGQPLDVVRNIIPSNNQLVIFPVTSDSYHQVAEVTCMDDCRLSINGWFHTKVSPVFNSPSYNVPESGLYSNESIKAKEVDIDLESWINEDYLNFKAIKLIQEHIEENSEISLRMFFKNESFNEILQTLRSEGNKLFFFVSRFILMFNYFQLLSDYNWQQKNELDLIMYFGCTKSSDVIGARTQYVTVEDEIQNALITLEPEQNNLNIVYRDSARFTKYFSKRSKCQRFYTLICSYSE